MIESIHINMLENYPSLIPSNNFKSWKGYIMLNTYGVYIEVSCPSMPLLDNLNVQIPEFETFDFHQFDLKETVETIKLKTHSLPEFLNELIPVLVKVWKYDVLTNVPNLKEICIDEKFYSVIPEVNLYGQYVHEIDENLNHITFSVFDMCRQRHFIKIFIPDEYPKVKKPLCFETMIPSVKLNLFLKVNTISNLFEIFKNVVNELSNFWNVHNEIISTCNTIGSYTFKDVNYRIPIDIHVCVEVEVDPLNPLNCPKFHLHGHTTSIEKFQKRLNKINPILIWSIENSFKENILNIFEVATLHSQYEEEKPDHVANQNDLNCCCICYDQLDTAIKNQTKSCVNEKCDALYHMSCICEWLLNSGSTPMFEHLQGKCPQCEEDMLVALENFDLIKT